MGGAVNVRELERPESTEKSPVWLLHAFDPPYDRALCGTPRRSTGPLAANPPTTGRNVCVVCMSLWKARQEAA